MSLLTEKFAMHSWIAIRGSLSLTPISEKPGFSKVGLCVMFIMLKWS